MRKKKYMYKKKHFSDHLENAFRPQDSDADETIPGFQLNEIEENW